MAGITPYVGTIGFKLIVEVVKASTGLSKDLSQATTKTVTVKKPGGVSFTREMEFETDGTDGKLQYTSISGDLSVIGIYVCQINLVLPDWAGPTSAFTFNVKATI
jgi:hypothetical protein